MSLLCISLFEEFTENYSFFFYFLASWGNRNNPTKMTLTYYRQLTCCLFFLYGKRFCINMVHVVEPLAR